MVKKENSKTGRQKSLTSILCVGLVLILASMLLLPTQGAAQPKTSEPKTLKIGALVCLTGWFSSMDLQMGNEQKLLAEMINEKGGINIKGQEYKIAIDTEDCKSSLDGVTAAATSMASKGIKFVIGPAAFFARASAPITNQNQILDVLGYCVHTPEEIGPNQPYTFSGQATAGSRFLSGVNLLKAKYSEVKNLCMVSPAGGINKYLEAFMRENLSRNGYKIVGEWVVYPDDASDWSPYAAKINANKQADAVFWLNCITFHVGNMVKSLREIGYNKYVFAWSNVPGIDVMKITGKEAANKVITQAITPNAKGNPSELEELIRRDQNKYGKDVPLYFDTSQPLYILAKIIQKAQSLDPAVVKTTWEAMDRQTVDSLVGTATICGTKTFGIKGHGLATPHPAQLLDKGKVSDLGWWDSGSLP